jgi:Flp pilus assembly protein TadG
MAEKRRNGVFGAQPVPSHQTRARTRRRHDESGTALVELALVAPIVIMFLGIAFNGWNGMQTSIRLTSAARAGALVAASDLSGNEALPPTGQPLTDATTAINNEEGLTGVYQSTDASANNYVSISTAKDTVSGGATISLVTVTIRHSSNSFVPFVGSFPVTTHATARYS